CLAPVWLFLGGRRGLQRKRGRVAHRNLLRNQPVAFGSGARAGARRRSELSQRRFFDGTRHTGRFAFAALRRRAERFAGRLPRNLQRKSAGAGSGGLAGSRAEVFRFPQYANRGRRRPNANPIASRVIWRSRNRRCSWPGLAGLRRLPYLSSGFRRLIRRGKKRLLTAHSAGYIILSHE